MAEPTNKLEFKAYIFRRLGYPVIQVNVDHEQAMDRIDDALAFYQDYHYLGSEKSIYIHTITEEEETTKKVTLPETIMTVSSILPESDGWTGSNFMNDEYQYMRAEFFSLARDVSYSLIPYYVAMTRMADINYLFTITPSIRFNKHKNQVEIIGDSSTYFKAGKKIAFETQAFINPNDYANLWKDRWLKRYATALMKRQWAENLKLYGNSPLLNGITIDGQSMFSEAIEEINTLEEKLIQSGNFPVLDEIA